ncbi:MAG TPA: hypothetical protein VMQ45_15690 [Burkholderiaceae bacterium]|nr:hypothetical protein [Burkholderiaceae bacterium]
MLTRPVAACNRPLRCAWCTTLAWLLAVALPPAIAGPTEANGERLADAIMRAQAQTDGSGGPVLYAFVDSRCAACQVLERRLQPLIRAGQLTVRWIPVRIAGSPVPAAESVQANTALLALLSGSVQTPTLAYRTQAGALRIQVGAPADLAQLLYQLR